MYLPSDDNSDDYDGDHKYDDFNDHLVMFLFVTLLFVLVVAFFVTVIVIIVIML